MYNSTHTGMASYSQRLGMYKNFRVGLIKFFQKGTGGRDSMLIEVVEYCNGTDGGYYSTYNLFVEFDDKYRAEVEYTSVGSWVLFGFYIQSFKNSNGGFNTILRLRHFDPVSTESSLYSITVKDPRTKEERVIMVPAEAHKLMQEITNKTQFNEYGTR